MKILVTEVRTYKKADAGYLLEGADAKFRMGSCKRGLPFEVKIEFVPCIKPYTVEEIKGGIIEVLKEMMSENEIHFEGNNILSGSDVIKIERAKE